MPRRRLPLPLLGSFLRRRMAVHVAGALATTLLLCETASADWPTDGAVLCTACRARGVLITSDGAGGAFVTWTDARNSPSGLNDDVFLQHVTGSGAIAPGWPADGLAVCLAPGIQGPEDIAPDGLGGVIVAWRDHRNAVPGGTGADIYAQRVLADGSLASGWPVGGVPVTQAPSDQVLPVVLGDGNGGAFITWDDEYASQPNAHMQYLAQDGTVAPGWLAGGLPVCTAPGLQAAGRLSPDGAGGCFIVWEDLRDGTPAVYAQRVTAAGQLFPGWPENGIRIVANRYLRDLVPDGAGGAYLSCATGTGGFDAGYYVQRFAGTGAIATGWPYGGAPVCLAPDNRVGLRMEPNGAGGVLLVWSDYRDHNDDDVYGLRMLADGTRAPGWPVDGLPVTDNTALDDYTDLAPDDQGGAYLCWDQYSTATGDQVMLRHVTAAGSLAAGLVVPSQVVNAIPHIVADGEGGAIITWADIFGRARALRVAPDGPTAVDLSLVSAEAEINRVRLRWFVAGAVLLMATVERRTPTDDWRRLADVAPDGTGRLEYEDPSVAPGARYGYRLAYRDAGALAYTNEAWVEVPALRFALRGLTPNPSHGDPLVSFSLANAGPATLELFDLRGRLLLAREVEGLGAGAHTLRMSEGIRLPAGVYALRLRQGSKVATARAVVIR